MDLAKQASADARPDAGAALAADGYVGGYFCSWHSPSGTVLGIALYQFATAKGADAYAQRFQQASQLVGGSPGESPIPLSSVPGAVGFVTVSGHALERVVFTRHSYLV